MTYIFLMLTALSTLRCLSMCPANSFRDVDGKCTVCPPGFIGWNCSTICPNGTYGAGCRYICTCVDCDPVSGCSPTSNEAVLETMSVTSKNALPTEGLVPTMISLVLLIVILAIVGLNFTVSIIIMWRFSVNYAKQHQEDRTSKQSSHQGPAEEIEMNAEGYESPIIPTERPEMRVYTELN